MGYLKLDASAKKRKKEWHGDNLIVDQIIRFRDRRSSVRVLLASLLMQQIPIVLNRHRADHSKNVALLIEQIWKFNWVEPEVIDAWT